jgi:electron transfer flavoprotein alpha/beta subunit
MKRELNEQQLAALRKNAAKGRKKLAQMRKAGIPIKKPGPKKNKAVEIPLAMVPAGPPPVPAKRRERVASRESVDALAQLIVATWAEVERRKGTL